MPEPAEPAQRSRLARLWPGRWTVARCVLLGMVTTVGVAWGLVASVSGWDERSTSSTFRREGASLVETIFADGYPIDESLAWPVTVPGHWPAQPDMRIRMEKLGYTSESFNIFAPPGPPIFTGRNVWVQRFGLPAKAMGLAEVDGVDSPVARGIVIGGAAMPIIPIWPGFLIDTLFWGAAWLGLITAFRALRARRRRKRGLCVVCKYELARLGVCPECGTSAPTQSRGLQFPRSSAPA